MNTARLAIAGGGVIGRRHACAIEEVSCANLVAIADPAPSVKGLADELEVSLYNDIGDLLEVESVDGVIVSTPTSSHFLPTITALNFDCHVLVEKPFMSTRREADTVIEKESVSRGQVLVGHHRRYYALVDKAREIIQSGGLGQLVALSGQWTVRKNNEYYASDWRKEWQAGPVLTNLIHELDSLRYICGDIESISAEISHSIRNWEKEDSAAVVMRFANGALGTFVLSDQTSSPWAWEFATGETPFFPKSEQNTVRFMGTRGALDFPNLVVWHHGEEIPDWNHVMKPAEICIELNDAYVRQIEHFCAVIDGREVPVISAQDAAATLRATLAVFESARTGCRVKV
ncbi:MAG: oxidoreductase [Magnetovibrio sp.]|nr:oxidoreductase [Magnetovibrio sp.]